MASQEIPVGETVPDENSLTSLASIIRTDETEVAMDSVAPPAPIDDEMVANASSAGAATVSQTTAESFGEYYGATPVALKDQTE
jgi:hypothetical protein